MHETQDKTHMRLFGSHHKRIEAPVVTEGAPRDAGTRPPHHRKPPRPTQNTVKKMSKPTQTRPGKLCIEPKPIQNARSSSYATIAYNFWTCLYAIGNLRHVPRFQHPAGPSPNPVSATQATLKISTTRLRPERTRIAPKPIENARNTG